MDKKLLIYSLNILKRYLFYTWSQTWDKARVEAYQDAKLKALVTHAARNVPYYRNLFREVGIDPAAFRGRADMHRIPLLDKDTLRRKKDEFRADNAESFGINWDSTSGSTGTPLHFIVDDAAKANKLAGVIRSYQWGGYVPGKRTFSLQSYKFPVAGTLFKHFKYVNLWRFDSKRLKRETGLEILNMINTIKPHMIIGFPFSILMVSQFAREEGIPLHPVRHIVTAGETLSESRRRLIEQAYRGEVFDFYSSHESVVIISECRQHTKHIHEDFSFCEVVDPSGNPVPDGEPGELVGTGFYNYGMPLIRYRTYDTIILEPGKRCSCGRQFRAVREIVGRQNDYLETPDGRFLGNVLEHSVDNARGVILSQCVQDAVDHIYINMIVDDSYTEESRTKFEEGLRLRLGNEIRIDFRIVTELERAGSGKTPFILSKIGHSYI